MNKKCIRFSNLFIVLAIISYSASTRTQTFTKITTGEFVNDGGASRSVNFIDYDGDGDLDLYVTNGKHFGQRNFLYQNNTGFFTRVFGISPVNDSLPFDGSSWGDFDNDGNPDLCIVAWYDSVKSLYKNNGGGVFTSLTGSVICTDRGFSETCSWGDYNKDGLIDIIVTNSDGVNWRNRLYKNTGSGNFSRIDTGAIFADINNVSRGVNWIDIDGDGDEDLFVCNESSQNEIMYKNDGNGYFVKVINIPPVTAGGNSWSSSWGDYDNDGDPDLYVANWNNQRNSLFRNDGNFNFTSILNDSIVNSPGYHACTGWGDYDNDGDLDMFVTQAYRTPNSPLQNKLFKNQLMETGNASFERITTGDPVNDPGYSYGFAWGDWDADGDLDIFTARTYNENQNNSAFLNNGNNNKWIEIKLTGTPTNRSAIGTKVRVRAIINGIPVWLLRIVEGQSGYCGQNLDLHFGLGNAAIIDSIKVEWLSGAEEYYTGVSVNQIIRIVEGTGIIGIQQNGTEIPEGFKLYQNYPNPFNPETNIKFDIPANNGDRTSNVKIEIFNLAGQKVAALIDQKLMAGSFQVNWNASNYSSGIYFYVLSSGGYKQAGKMVLIK
jgi:hypothetical protein